MSSRLMVIRALVSFTGVLGAFSPVFFTPLAAVVGVFGNLSKIVVYYVFIRLPRATAWI